MSTKEIDNNPERVSLFKFQDRMWALVLPESFDISETESAFVSTAMDNEGKKLRCLLIPIEEVGRGKFTNASPTSSNRRMRR